METIVGFIAGLLVGVIGMTAWLEPMISSLREDRLKQDRTIAHLQRIK